MSAVKLTSAQYFYLAKELLKMGYTAIPKKKKSQDLFRLEITTKRKIKGSERGFMYSNNEYTSKIWPSFLEEENKFRDVGTDAGWAIIAQADELVYSAKPLSRTGDYIKNLLSYAWVTKWKIDNIPLCPCQECKGKMFIYRKKGTRKYMYACKEIEKHPDKKWIFRDWDYNLPPKAKAFVEIRREKTAEYKKKKWSNISAQF